MVQSRCGGSHILEATKHPLVEVIPFLPPAVILPHAIIEIERSSLKAAKAVLLA
jgi:hypothetical protein